MSARYVPCQASDVPGGVRFDSPARHQGQIVEVEYGGFELASHDSGAPYRRQRDRSIAGDPWAYERTPDARDELVRVEYYVDPGPAPSSLTQAAPQRRLSEPMTRTDALAQVATTVGARIVS